MTRVEKHATPGGTLLLSIDYKYDVFGNRIEQDKWTSGTGHVVTRFAYDGSDVWADLDGSSNLTMRYLLGESIDERFARVNSSGTAAWYLVDHLGSVKDIVNASGGVIDTIAYDAFGNVTSETSPTNGDRYKFTGREQDSDTGMQFNRKRYDNLSVARWTTEDPEAFGVGDTK